ncbi:helix-turn-helix transcriptional regulator [Endothiovibrio diazotrophicus]
MTIDLVYCDPAELADHADFDTLERAIDALDSWEARPAEVLDFVYRSRLIRLLQERAPLERLRELNDHLGRVAHRGRRAVLDALEPPYHARWTTYREILEDRIAALDSAASDRLLDYAHVAEALASIGEAGEIGQKKLGEALGLSKPNLTRVLKLMEANELIERRRAGRENRIALGLNAPRDPEPPAADDPAEPSDEYPRLGRFLTLRAA